MTKKAELTIHFWSVFVEDEDRAFTPPQANNSNTCWLNEEMS